jgi:hypothetical protein
LNDYFPDAMMPATVATARAMFDFEPAIVPPEAEVLRQQVRAFLGAELQARTAEQRARSWSGFDAGFSRALGARGWIGITWPTQYGGQGRSAIERYVLLEELLAAGAPVAAHWIADRQSGPLLLRYGSEEQRRAYLPHIARGEMFFCIGMSEPNAGSDLAAITSHAARTPTGWSIRGQKLWTTNAHRAHCMIALLRTSPGAERHSGLSQFLIDLSLPGLTIRPIVDLTGEHHFNEVFFDDVHVGEQALIGTEGEGWKQVTAELSLERSGPERYLSSFQLFELLVQAGARNPSEPLLGLIGQLAAELWTLRQMSLSVASQLARGRDPVCEAAMVKDLGNSFEQRLPQLAQALSHADVDLIGEDSLNRVLAYLLQTSQSFSLRGGTREILRGIVARGMGLR